MPEFNWTCPHCSKPQIVTDKNWSQVSGHLRLTELDIGPVGTRVIGISCLNKECKKLTLTTYLLRAENQGYAQEKLMLPLDDWRLMPESSAVAQPDYVPAPIVEDYYEACRIRDLSPKSSATLARRCLQGMIRDFCKIKKSRLVDEIVELKAQVEKGSAPSGVTAETVDAIDHVRKIGNIGAHMEMDVNLVVEIEPGEAQALIELIEMLFEEWYVARQKRADRLSRIEQIGTAKAALKISANKSQS